MNCNYGSETMDLKLLTLRLLNKIWVVLLAALLGVLCVGGPYFLRHVTFGPAKEYEAVTDFYIDYGVQENGAEYTYFNQTTWEQLMVDDVFTDRILEALEAAANDTTGTEAMTGAETMTGADTMTGAEAMTGAGEMANVDTNGNSSQTTTVSKEALRTYLHATLLSDTRLVTTTVTTNSPELTMAINAALITAMEDFADTQKEIAGVQIFNQPTAATQVIFDVRTFRACMLGLVIFVCLTLLYMLLYYILDDGIYVPETFEKRYGIPMFMVPDTMNKMLTEFTVPDEPVTFYKSYRQATNKVLTENRACDGYEAGVAARCLHIDVEDWENTLKALPADTADMTVLTIACTEDATQPLSQTATKTEARVTSQPLSQTAMKTEPRVTSQPLSQTAAKTEPRVTSQPLSQTATKTEAQATPQIEHYATILLVRAGAHNGKLIEHTLSNQIKLGEAVDAALLWQPNEKLLKAYYAPQHVLSLWKKKSKA